MHLLAHRVTLGNRGDHGTARRQRVRVAGKGEPGVSGAPAGDLYLIISIKAHPLFERDGDDLAIDLRSLLLNRFTAGPVAVDTEAQAWARAEEIAAQAQAQKDRFLGARGRREVEHEDARGDHAAELDDEHHRVARLAARVELRERIPDRRENELAREDASVSSCHQEPG